MVSTCGELPWLRRSRAKTRCWVASRRAAVIQFRPEPKRPCMTTIGVPVSPYDVTGSFINDLSSPTTPARGVPVPPFVEGLGATESAEQAGVVRPDHHMRGGRRDQLVAAGTAVGLAGRGARHPPDVPLPVRALLACLGTTQ